MKIDVGPSQAIKVDLPLGGRGRDRFYADIRPGRIAVHDGEDPDDARAFAAHLCRVWLEYIARHGVRRV